MVHVGVGVFCVIIFYVTMKSILTLKRSQRQGDFHLEDFLIFWGLLICKMFQTILKTFLQFTLKLLKPDLVNYTGPKDLLE